MSWTLFVQLIVLSFWFTALVMIVVERWRK